MAIENPKSNSDFQNVSTVAAGYLAVTWLFTQLTLSQTELSMVYVMAFFGILMQLPFAYVFRGQQDERCKQLGISTRKPGLVRDSDGDVVVKLLNALIVMLIGWTFIFMVVALVSKCLPVAHVHPFFQRLQ